METRMHRFHHLRLETLESRLPPGDGCLGLLLTSQCLPLSLAEWESMGSGAISRSEVTLNSDDNVESPVVRVHGADSQAMRLERCAAGKGTGESALPLAAERPDFTALHTAGERHRSQLERTWQTGFAAGPILAAPQGMTNPSLALRAGVRLSLEGEVSAVRTHTGAPREQGEENYGKLDLAFEENVGQTDSRVDFITRAGGYTAFLTPTGAVFSIQNSESRIQNSESADRRAGRVNALDAASLQGVNTPRSPESTTGVALHMEIVGAKPQAAVGREQLPGKANYFIGNDPSQWRSNVSTYGRVEYDDVYPGIDLVYYGKDQQLEYDFIVSPGVDPNQITLNFAGADGVEIDDGGNLVLRTAAGDLVQQKPYVYQDIDGVRQEVAGSFGLGTQYSTPGTFEVTFDIGTYDESRPLVIDPLVLSYSTYLGGGSATSTGYEDAQGIAVDDSGYAYVTGESNSTKFPTTPGAYNTEFGGATDAYVAKFNPDGTGLIYATYLGGSNYEEGRSIALDANNNSYLTGQTQSADFPTTPGAYDTVSDSGFVTKLSPDGATLVYSTFWDAIGLGIAVDTGGNAYVTGQAVGGYPTTAGALDTSYNGGGDAYVTKLNATGTALVYSTFLGGAVNDTSNAIAVDTDGNAFVVGTSRSVDFPTTAGALDTTYNGDPQDAFVSKLSATGDALVYSTYLGGGDEDIAYGIAVGTAGNAFVTGRTLSLGFPTTTGVFDSTYNGGFRDGFVSNLNPVGSALVYSTFLGGSSGDEAVAIAVDINGIAYVAGSTGSTNFPTTPGSFDTTSGGGSDAYLTAVSSDGTTLSYSTFLGGANSDGALGVAHANGGVYVAGSTNSSNYPSTPDALKRRNRNGVWDGFVTKFAEA